MASVKILAGLLALALAGPLAAADDGGGRDRYRKALELYENGMYEEARTIFETLEGNALVDGYTVLCAVKLRSGDYEALMGEYERRNQQCFAIHDHAFPSH